MYYIGVLETIVLCFIVQGEDVIEHINGKRQVFILVWKRKTIFEDTKAKCHKVTLMTKLLNISVTYQYVLK